MAKKLFNTFPSLVLILLFITGCSVLPEQKDPTAGWSAERIYQAARTEFTAGDYEKAIEYYELLEARYPYGRYAQQAQIETAYTYYKQNEIEPAMAATDRFIKMYPNHPNLDYVYYLRGLIYFAEDRSLTADYIDLDLSDRDPKAAQVSFNNFRELTVRFPESQYAADAAFRMRYLRNMLSLHEVGVAKYYMKRGAYLAAANRAQLAIQQYPEAPATEEALYLLVQAYDKLGMSTLREDAFRVYQTNFPDSPYAKGIDPDDDRPWWKIWR